MAYSSFKKDLSLPAKQHILLVSSSLDVPSGYEKAVTETAGLFATHGHPVTVLILDHTSVTYFPVHPAVKIIHLPIHFGITEKGNPILRKWWFWKHTRLLKKKLMAINPDLIIGTEYHFTAALVFAGLHKDYRIFSWEHHHYYWIKKNRFWSALTKKAYRKIESLICLNNQEAAILNTMGNTVVIPNVTQPQHNHSRNENQQLLTVAGLIQRKGIDLLLKAAEQVLTENPGWTWKLIGDGPLRSSVLEFIRNKKLENRLILQSPAGPDISADYQQTAIYVMTSRFEAFPLVLLEAMSWGIPCISFNCPSGPNEIIQDGKTGLLVPPEDISALITAINSLITNKDLRINMSVAGLQAVQQYYPESVYKKWQAVFDPL
jgi:glycosyltransferase involved in cell wall biosynthesis